MKMIECDHVRADLFYVDRSPLDSLQVWLIQSPFLDKQYVFSHVVCSRMVMVKERLSVKFNLNQNLAWNTTQFGLIIED